jgi:aryl-alcohol dehydrogenase-like predicted oxidoreductase
MRTRALGRGGPEVSVIGYGAWPLSNNMGAVSDRDAAASVEEALAQGITFFDTAEAYRPAEERLGPLLRPHRERLFLATKVAGSNLAAAHVREAVENSLRLLQTDVLDIVVVHSPPPELFDGRVAPHYGIFEDLKREGLIRAYGGSVDFPQDIDTLLETTASTALEVYLSAFHQETWEATERAGDAGVGSAVKVPLESGWLAGAYGPETVFSDVRSRWTADEVRRRAALTEQFRALVPEGLTVAQTALRFVLANRGVSTVIPGARTTAQLAANLAAADDDLPGETVAAIRALFARELASSPLPW